MSNYRVILQHSIPAEPITGRMAVPGLWVKFENGAAEVKDEKVIELMKAHRLFGSDFVIVEDVQVDPYEDMRNSVEPDHNITEIKYGHVESSTSPRQAIAVTKETKRALMGMAQDMAKEMAPAMAKEMLREVLSQNPELVKGALTEASGKTEETTEEAPKTRRGRPKQIK